MRHHRLLYFKGVVQLMLLFSLWKSIIQPFLSDLCFHQKEENSVQGYSKVLGTNDYHDAKSLRNFLG